MKSFPSNLTPEKKHKFSIYKYNRVLSLLRTEITELVLEGDENNYFELDNFQRRHKIRDEELNKMFTIVSEELKQLGWNVKTSFANTGMFIYSTDEPPPSCHDDMF
jgi:hypothetical protein